jgi:hypothetical protein
LKKPKAKGVSMAEYTMDGSKNAVKRDLKKPEEEEANSGPLTDYFTICM